MSRWHLGTAGFSHGDWQRSFYPSRITAAGRLGWYASQFNAVELESTTRGLPKPEQVARWRDAVPAGFRYAAIAPETISRVPGRLDAAPRLRQLQRLTERLEPLGNRLGAILIRLGPEIRHQRFGELQVLLEAASGTGCRFALEIAHPSWWQAETAELLAEHNVAWAYVDAADRSIAGQAGDRVPQGAYRPRLPPRTADFLYLRWLGQPRQYSDLGREHLNPDPRLAWWLQLLQRELNSRPAPGGVFGFFSNDFAGHGPATCRRFKQLLRGEPVQEVPLGQAPLFQDAP